MYEAHLLANKKITSDDPSNIYFYKDVERIKTYKIKIRKKLIYKVELFYYKRFAFIKFHPAKMDNSPDKYKFVGVGLRIGEIKGLLYTCSNIVKDELQKYTDYNFAFIGQPYDKDDKKQRRVAKRFDLYIKQVSTDFYDENDGIKHFYIEDLNFYTIYKKDDKKFKKDVTKFIEYIKNNDSIMQDCMTQMSWNNFLESNR